MLKWGGVNYLASLGFEQSESAMYQDTEAHVLESDCIQLGYVDGELKGFALYSACVGSLAVELVGIAIDPRYQGNGFGGQLVADYVENKRPTYLTAYIRNPSTVGILNRYNGAFPLNTDKELELLAGSMNGAEFVDGVAYHVGRYGQEGLYGISDPANRSLRGDNISLKKRFPELSNPGSALVLASKVIEESEI